MKYHIWTAGCQMNVVDSQRTASALEKLGYTQAENSSSADVIVINTCVVRQSAEDKAHGYLTSLKGRKEKDRNLIINLMGCMVGVKNTPKMKELYPYVDVFSPPSDLGPLVSFLTQDESREISIKETSTRNKILDNELILPKNEQGKLYSAFVPIVLGCSHACTYCIIPYRRGIEISRPAADIISEVESLASQGIIEITLLGQIVDRYGKDLEDGSNLSKLLKNVSAVNGIKRVRFLTSHPNWMTEELLQTVAETPNIMPHIEVPVQAGNDQVLENMKREYSRIDYIKLIKQIREIIPGVSIGTDIIVGFPGETEEQFMDTFDLLEELRLDVTHLARYSTRKGTVAQRRLGDDVLDEEKWRRFRMLEEQQSRIVGEINAKLLGSTQKVLVEEKVRGRWKARTPNTKLVFIESEENLSGKIVSVEITWTGPWSMQGRLISNKQEMIQVK